MKADGLMKALNPMKQAHFIKIIGLIEIITLKEENDSLNILGAKLSRIID
jgi:hypothetical protein